MKSLRDKILQDGVALGTEILKVDSFLNHQIDTDFMLELGKEFHRRFANTQPTKILTMESSGIAVAFSTAMCFGNIPIVFAKKTTPNTMVEDCYSADVMSFTKGKVSSARVAKKFIGADDRILIIDDFLAHGEAASGMVEIVAQAGAELLGIGIVIEKEFQGGGEKLTMQGCHLESLAVIHRIEDGKIFFAE